MSLLASLLIVNALHGPVATRPAPAAPADSVGQEFRNGQRLVRHRVAQGETLFALARRYHVAVEQITAANPQLKNGLAIGEVVLVPRPGGAGAKPTAATPAKAPAAAITSAPERYTVAQGETLFGIARRYKLSPAELIQLNHLPAGGAVRVGQEILLREAGSSSAVAAPAARAPETSAPKVNPNAPAQIATITTAKEPDADPVERAPTRASEVVTRVTESGVAGAIAGSGTDKYLALHKTAPVGTIMQVKNQMNGQSVYVRVIGALPETGENANLLVRLSPRAVQKLGTGDAKFRVETSYVP